MVAIMLRQIIQGTLSIVLAGAVAGLVVMYDRIGSMHAMVEQMAADQKVTNAEFRAEIRRLNGIQVNHERRPHGTRMP